MSFELRSFQEEAVTDLLEKFQQARNAYKHAAVRSAIGLTATTGAGKTVIASSVIEAVLFGSDRFGIDPDRDAIFLWMTDLPELNIQTQEKMMLAASRLRWDVLPIVTTAFHEETLSPGRVYFINTQLLAKTGLLTKEGPTLKRAYTFWDVVRRTIEDAEGTGAVLYLIVDEAHRGMAEGRDQAEANSIIQRFIKGYPEQSMPAVPVVWGISATPQRFLDLVEKTDRARFRCDVPPEKVRESGLIKEKTKAEFAGEKQTDAMALFPEAVKVWWKATADWEAYRRDHGNGEPLVVPAFVIQVENVGDGSVSQTNLAALIKGIVDLAGPLPADAFAHAFGEHIDLAVGDRIVRYLEPSNIAADPDARVILFKDALGTGWDCPRAEVLFSFRSAADVTSIAQTIGRMVRAPLARRIDENEALNAAYVFLPHYNKTAVQSIIDHLTRSGNEAIASTIETSSTSVALPLRDLPAAIEAINRVPTYVVPTSPLRSSVKFLAKMSNFLSSSGIDAPAKQREAGDGAALLVEQQRVLAGDPSFQREVDEEGEIIVERAEALTGESNLLAGSTRRLQATEETINREFAEASGKVTPEVADAYARRRLVDGTTVRQAKLEARALSARVSVLDKLERWASGRIDALRQEHGAAVEQLSASARARYFDGILQQAPDPTERAMRLPETADFRRGEDAVPLHLYAIEGTEPAFAFGSSWEKDTIEGEVGNASTVAWLRNVDRAKWSLRISRREGNQWRPFYPDFLVVRQDGGRMVVDILDPHDHTKTDAVSKAKGLSLYARRHAEKVGQVVLIAKIDDRYRRLHLEREVIRKQVDTLSDTDNAGLAALFRREG